MTIQLDSTRKRTGAVVLVVIAIAFVASVILSGGTKPDPLDTRSCPELFQDFSDASEHVKRLDRGSGAFEYWEDVKWAAYDQSRALDCGHF